GHGVFPNAPTAKELLLSGADRNNNDAFKAGAGFGNALRSTDLASGRGGIRASPYAWYPGDHRGVDYPTSVHILGEGEADTGADELPRALRLDGREREPAVLGAVDECHRRGLVPERHDVRERRDGRDRHDLGRDDGPADPAGHGRLRLRERHRIQPGL